MRSPACRTGLRLRTRSQRLRQDDGDAGVFIRRYLFPVEVAAVCDRFEYVHSKRLFGLRGHPRKLRAVAADVRDVVRNDQMVLGIDGGLDVVADDSRTEPADGN